MRVLIIEDDKGITSILRDYLTDKGHVTSVAEDGITGLHLAVVNDYDAIVLDLMLPGMDGVDVCRKLRHEARKNTPVLILTARDTLPEKLAGFNSGADDYMVKPFALQEIEARLQALTRRGAAPGSTIMQVADLVYDPLTRRVRRGGVDIHLAPVELKILALLMRESHRVVARDEIETVVWGNTLPETDSLRAHMHTLRNAIDRPFSTPLLHTIHGIGYRLVSPDAL